MYFTSGSLEKADKWLKNVSPEAILKCDDLRIVKLEYLTCLDILNNLVRDIICTDIGEKLILDDSDLNIDSIGIMMKSDRHINNH
jgi:hypothetical protein